MLMEHDDGVVVKLSNLLWAALTGSCASLFSKFRLSPGSSCRCSRDRGVETVARAPSVVSTRKFLITYHLKVVVPSRPSLY